MKRILKGIAAVLTIIIAATTTVSAEEMVIVPFQTETATPVIGRDEAMSVLKTQSFIKSLTDEEAKNTEDEETVAEPVKIVDCEMPAEHQQFLYELCEKNSINFELAVSLIYTESRFDNTAESVYACGYMQINEAVNYKWLHEELGVEDLRDPYQNMESGIFILKTLFDKYENTNMVLMAYNMGASKASNYWKQGVYTSSYCQKIAAYQATLVYI